jgi:murein DD-endopeptidase MepM/ murein hydrolase activator NlpD
LGEDWNGNGGGNTDLGDPVYATANGLVTFTEDVCCGWGNIVRIVHKLPNHSEYNFVESLYAHMHNINVKNGELVKRGQQIGTIGTAHGRYSAHLHFEMRAALNMSIGQGYAEDQSGYLAPTDFIKKNRPLKN